MDTNLILITLYDNVLVIKDISEKCLLLQTSLNNKQNKDFYF